MPKREVEEFLRIKGEVLDNIETLLIRIDQCQQQGMVDPSSTMYNELLLISDEAEVSSTYEELEEVETKAKELEQNVDVWLARHGETTISLLWPNLKPFLEK